ncbi:hypothetical protein Swit_3485 [Rhizorhabdus wittichii RW1]|uniref:DUF4258 domain-containing protein n=1 Tax=Rhizorhabdus wittichii (strain DSM 6014 / CCUG 31198 / JCM 15750 / NBRC 105917 / EY 4224 / RW1) TaxID=392499 RepID=A0A9J9LG28_RHIWR|nr:hypothetical protein Swit_3485 [Rhizorhabdus wittichii RW1]
MTNLQTTNHGLQRMSQRGLTVSDIDLIMAVGCEVPDGVLVRRKDCDEIERRLKEIIARVKRLEGKRLVVCDGRLVTAYCQSACKRDPLSARKRDPLSRWRKVDRTRAFALRAA